MKWFFTSPKKKEPTHFFTCECEVCIRYIIYGGAVR